VRYDLCSEYFVQYGQFLTRLARHNISTRQSELLVWQWRPIEPATMVPEDCWLHHDKYENEAFLQAMMDAAWERGLKPAGYRNDNPQLDAIKYHLEDMRKLVFKETK
jgi:hypothetical protein